ncbi:hypothetical protein HPB47_015397 [Ixodes persulcatus]|uniref:Uncharacterized protein n=1 Tax=Ixodes persulcatus TaxID=34615 RepID=A0AC60QTM1_IXOPE|nr:hypothetical protein HPB47_015397 [Ixodes persulcatus]
MGPKIRTMTVSRRGKKSIMERRSKGQVRIFPIFLLPRLWTLNSDQLEERFNVVFHSKEPYDLASIPAASLQRNFLTKLGLNLAACQKTELPTFRVNKAANTITVTVRDRKHVALLLKVTSIKSHEKAVEVVEHETPPRDTCRGVAHGIDPQETLKQLEKALSSRSHEIIHVRPLSGRGLALVTFVGKRPPRSIVYHGLIIRVTLYKPTTMMCQRCQGLGHKENVCTRKPRCRDCGCIFLEGHVCERQYCTNCKASTHLAADPTCPTRQRVNLILQARAQGGGARGSKGKGGSTSNTQKPPRVTPEHYPTLKQPGILSNNERTKNDAYHGARTAEEKSRSQSRQKLEGTNSRHRSPSLRRNNHRGISYAHTARSDGNKGYYANDEAEIKAWQKELHAMEDEDKSDTAILKQMKADLLKFERKIEEDKQKREARKATIARRFKEAMETRKAIQDANQQEREQTRREASQEQRKTRRLLEIIEHNELELVNGSTKPTRHATASNQTDSIIDVTLATPATVRKLSWDTMRDAWGSDHFPIIIDAAIGSNNLKPKRPTQTIIWDKFRENLEEQREDLQPHQVTALLTAAIHLVTEVREVRDDTPEPDYHLLALWDKRTKALEKYRKGKLKKHLDKVNRLTEEANKYS